MSSDTPDAPETKPEVKLAYKRPPMSFKYKLVLIVMSLLMMAVLRTGFMFIVVALLPAIIAYYMDSTAERYLYKTVAACNLTALLPYFVKLMTHGPTNGTLQVIMNSAHTWVTIIGGALMGFLLIRICPSFVQFAMSGIVQTQIHHLENTLERIEKEWGPEVKQLSIQHDQEDLDRD